MNEATDIAPEKDRSAAYTDAARELSISIGLGLVPFLGQAVDIYDTLESIWRLNGSRIETDKDDAKFDLVLALIGWVPGPGDGVKKSLRLVNKDPQRFAPIMFDLLREVLVLCKVKTSPEALLDELFDAGKLHAQLGEIRKSVEGSSLFKELSPDYQRRAQLGLNQIEQNLPSWMRIVQKRLKKWKAVQPNSSARPNLREKKTTEKPGNHEQTAKDGKGHPVQGQTNSEIYAQLATEPLPMGHTLFGVSGEHIADYHCAEKWGWAKGWVGHDLGNGGEWKTKPNKTTPGKLSNQTKLFHLTNKPNDQGIDAVWRVPAGDTHNHGKPYAIIEVKAGQTIEAKSFYKNTAKGKKRSVTGKLGVTGRSKLEDLLVTDPPGMDDETPATPKKKSGKGAGKSGGGKNTKAEAPKTKETKTDKKDKQTSDKPTKNSIMVQMSHEWIAKNANKAVNNPMLTHDILYGGAGKSVQYSRHLFDIPRNLPCAEQHAQAYEKGTTGQASTHTDHDVDKNQRHDESDVKRAVNIKKANLRKKYPNMKSLEAEK